METHILNLNAFLARADTHTEKFRDQRRIFSQTDRGICWRSASVVPGRHPRRWRFDRAGNIVCRVLHGCEGPLCYEYDHRTPWSHGGRSDSGNCDVLQTALNRWKSNQQAQHISDALLRRHSRSLSRPLSEAELDVIEYVIYGDILRPDGRRLTELPVLSRTEDPKDHPETVPRVSAKLSTTRRPCGIM